MRLTKKLLFCLPIILFLLMTGCEKDSVLPADNNDTELTEHREEKGEEQKESTTTIDRSVDEKKEATPTEEIEKQIDDSQSQEQNQSNNTNGAGKAETSKKANTTKTEEKQNRTEKDPASSTTKQENKQEQPKQTKKEPSPYVFITIKALDEVFIPKTKVEIGKNTTIINATIDLLKPKKISYSVTGSGAQTYVEGIGNYYEFDFGPLSGWLVKKNGVLLDRSSGTVKVSHGDEIEWIYTEDYTKE